MKHDGTSSWNQWAEILADLQRISSGVTVNSSHLSLYASSDLNKPGLFFFYQPVSCQSGGSGPHLRLPQSPPEALLPVAAHLVQPPARSHSISLIKGRVCPFVHSHPHGRRGTTHSNAAYRCLLSLIRAQLAGSRDRPCSCSHTPAAMTSPLSSSTDSSTLSPFLFILSFCYQVTFPLTHKHTQKERERAGCDSVCLAGLTAQIAHLRQKGCMYESTSALGWDNDRRGGDGVSREELIWVSKHLIKKLPASEALQAAACGASGAEPLLK